MMAKPPSRAKRIWDKFKIDPQQLKGLAYLLVLVLAGNAGTGKLLTQKIDQATDAATSLVETNATHAKQLLQSEVGRLTGIIDSLKTSAKTEIEQARAKIDEARLNAEKFQLNVESRLKNTPEHEHLWGNWTAPQQIDGSFVQPQFFQTKECKICGEAELKKAARP